MMSKLFWFLDPNHGSGCTPAYLNAVVDKWYIENAAIEELYPAYQSS